MTDPPNMKAKCILIEQRQFPQPHMTKEFDDFYLKEQLKTKPQIKNI